MKNKSIKELYNIAIGKRFLDIEAEEGAEKELKSRNLFLDNPSKIKNKIELEDLIREQEDEIRKKGILFDFESKPFLLIVGLIMFLSCLYILSVNDLKTNDLTIWFLLIVSSTLSVLGYFENRNKKKRSLYRTKRINELMHKL